MKNLIKLNSIFIWLVLIIGLTHSASAKAVSQMRFWDPARFEVSLLVEIALAEVDVMYRITDNTYLGLGAGYGMTVKKFVSYPESHLTNGVIFDLDRSNLFITHVHKNTFWTLGASPPRIFYHFDDSDDDPGGGIGYFLFSQFEITTNSYYGKYFRLGLRAEIALLDEGRHDKRNGLLFSIIPVTLRLAIPF